MQTVLSALAVTAIRGYQVFLSPRKGWRCAHGVIHGGPSCSAFAVDQLRAYPLHRALEALRMRFRECAAAARAQRASDDDDEIPEGEYDEHGVSTEYLRAKKQPKDRSCEAKDCIPGPEIIACSILDFDGCTPCDAG